MVISKKERESIRNLLPYGFQAKIAKDIGLSRMTVNLYLKGKNDNPKVEEAIIKELFNLKKKEKHLKVKLNEIQSE